MGWEDVRRAVIDGLEKAAASEAVAIAEHARPAGFPFRAQPHQLRGQRHEEAGDDSHRPR
jgi:hypothetical protein